MKVKMLKNHQGFKKNQVVDVTDERAAYWIGCSVAVKELKKTKQTKELKQGKKTK